MCFVQMVIVHCITVSDVSHYRGVCKEVVIKYRTSYREVGYSHLYYVECGLKCRWSGCHVGRCPKYK